jgi:NFU1 iron-sulfur cluster scaffold homolog, mitochondrial
MFIQTEDTPNPNSIKFLPGKDVCPEQPMNFKTKDDCAESPLAQQLFEINHVDGVFFGKDFVTITKEESSEWGKIKSEILLSLMDFFSAGSDVILKSKKDSTKSSDADDNKIVSEIKEIIEQKVRPAVAQDGGDIIFHSFQNGIVKLELHGACSGCPSSTVTLKNGIENMLKHYVPEVESVEAVDGDTA